MKETASKGISLRLSSIFGGAASEPESAMEEVPDEIRAIAEEDAVLQFDINTHPNHPQDTFADYFQMKYFDLVEPLEETLGAGDPIVLTEAGDYMTTTGRNVTAQIDNSDTKQVVAHKDTLQDLPENHPLREIANKLPENDTLVESAVGSLDQQAYSELENEVKEVLRETMIRSGKSWDETWGMLEEDAETAEATIMEYNDKRNEPDSRLEAIVPNADFISHSKEDLFGNLVYHGNTFDAVCDGNKSHIQFHEPEFYVSPEKVLSEEKYRQVRAGEVDYDELSRDEQVLFEIYSSTRQDKEYNFE